MQYYKGKKDNGPLPWSDPDEALKNVIDEWKSTELTLQAQFQARQQMSKVEMKKMIAHYLSLLFGQIINLFN
ncbi:hypothetical protein ACI2OX_10945 [Bacillus sp. N9]